MYRSVWNDILNWQTKQLNSYTKSQHHALTTMISKKKKMDLLENYLKFAHRLFCNVFTWLVLVDLIFCGPYTNWPVQLQNGLKLVTNVEHVSYLTFISRSFVAQEENNRHQCQSD